MSLSLSKSLENRRINQPNSIFYKKGILWSIDRSLRPKRKHMNYFASPGIFVDQGRRTEYLHGVYGIEGKFASEWQDWRTLKGTLVRDLIEKRNVEKTLFLIGTTTAKTTPRPPVIPEPINLGRVCRDSSEHENQCPDWAKRRECDKEPWLDVG